MKRTITLLRKVLVTRREEICQYAQQEIESESATHAPKRRTPGAHAPWRLSLLLEYHNLRRSHSSSKTSRSIALCVVHCWPHMGSGQAAGREQSGTEWSFLESLCDLLEIFTKVTRQMSQSKTPTLPWVLPMYEMMLKYLRGRTDDAKFGVAAAAGLEKLET
ncbi:hypothetical protein B0H14DRAFT_2621147 [Mycena olivaceomarginata]|nr:hypothetical protein B0H14DRAFT_2621147 [Mycena olivaceomarginata]